MPAPESPSPTPGSSDSASSPVRMSRVRKFFAAAFLFVFVILIGFGCWELAFRLVLNVTDVPLYAWDPALGPRIAPGQTGKIVQGDYIEGRYHFNSDGWNHPRDYVLTKTAGTRRICLVGDSYVEALQVNVEDTCFNVAEKKMNRPDRPVEWLSFGCSGWGTTQEYEAIKTYTLNYQPDVVVLLFVQNDPMDSSPYLRPIEKYYVTYALDEQGELAKLSPIPWEPSRFRRLIAHSAVARYCYIQRGLLNRFRYQDRPPAGGAPLREGTWAGNVHQVAGLEKLTTAQRQEKTWELIEKTLRAARDECRQRGAVFALAYRGSAGKIEHALTPRQKYAPPPKESDPYCLEQRADEMGVDFLAPIAQRLGIPYLDLTPHLYKMVDQTRKSHIFPDDGHYNTAAHAAVGTALANWVEGLLQNAPSSIPSRN